jgi:hypothetical protein
MLLVGHHRFRISAMPMTAHRTQAAFTMVVIAVLFVALSVIAAVAVERNTTLQLINRRNEASAQLSRLSYALLQYAVFNKSGSTLLYPCPALLTVAATNSDFGKQVLTSNGYAANCSSTAGDTGANPSFTSDGLAVMGVAATPTIRGMVPVHALAPYGISISDAFDPWDNRIIYIVNRTLTKESASFLQAANPTISDPRPNVIATPAPDFILISYGRDGVGATKRNSTSVAISCSSASDIIRLENCDSDTSFLTTPIYTSDTASGTATTVGNTAYFDDIVSYYRQ